MNKNTFSFSVFFLFIFCISSLPIQAQEYTDSEENVFHIYVHYPKKVRVNQEALVEIELPPFMPEGSTPTVRIESSTSPQEDFSLIEAMPISSLTFHKAGTYAFSVHIGFSLKDL